jgi:hypothetical protein
MQNLRQEIPKHSTRRHPHSPQIVATVRRQRPRFLFTEPKEGGNRRGNEMTQSEALFEFYKLDPKYRGVLATESMLLANAQRPITPESLQAAAARLGDRLAISGDYTRAYAALYRNHPEVEECAAVNDILDRELHGDDVTVENLESLLEIPRIRAMLPESAGHAAERREQAERVRLIQEITQGRTTTYGWHDPRHGTTKYFPVAHLAGETTERLEEIASILREQRRIAGTQAPREQVQPPMAPSVLVNPTTGAEYTKRELIAVINSGKHALRQLLCGSNGATKPGVKEAIERILRGTV